MSEQLLRDIRTEIKNLKKQVQNRRNMSTYPISYRRRYDNELREQFPNNVYNGSTDFKAYWKPGSATEKWALAKFWEPVTFESLYHIFGPNQWVSRRASTPSNEDIKQATLYPIMNDYNVNTITWNLRGTLSLGIALVVINAVTPDIFPGFQTMSPIENVEFPTMTYGVCAKVTASESGGSNHEYWNNIDFIVKL